MYEHILVFLNKLSSLNVSCVSCINIYRRLFNNAIKFAVMHTIKLIKINNLVWILRKFNVVMWLVTNLEIDIKFF